MQSTIGKAESPRVRSMREMAAASRLKHERQRKDAIASLNIVAAHLKLLGKLPLEDPTVLAEVKRVAEDPDAHLGFRVLTHLGS